MEGRASKQTLDDGKMKNVGCRKTTSMMQGRPERTIGKPRPTDVLIVTWEACSWG